MFTLISTIEELWTFLMSIIKFPLRIICKTKGEHNWINHSGGFLFNCKYSFTCKTCGLRCKGDLDELNKHGFNGEARIK